MYYCYLHFLFLRRVLAHLKKKKIKELSSVLMLYYIMSV